MGDLVKTLDRYFEFLLLGLLMVSILVAWARTAAGERWNKLVLPEVVDSRYPKVRMAVHGGILVGVLFLTGVAINALSYWFLQPAHIHVVHATTSGIENEREFSGPDPVFFGKPFTRSIEQEPFRSYLEDAKQQIRWGIVHSESFDDAVSWALKYVRIVRGLVLLSVTLFFASLLALPWGKWRRAWALGAVVAAICYYLTMGMYWQYEIDVHHSIAISEETLNQLPPESVGKASRKER